jgi:CRISPR-associated protein (TIGR03984 family)
MNCQPLPLPRIEPLKSEEIAASFADLPAGLAERAGSLGWADGVAYALIHADDGVIWGRIETNADAPQLVVPDQSDWTPPLRRETIQQCRIFGAQGEWFVWRTAENEWRGRLVIEEPEADYQPIEETQILIGSRVHRTQPAPAGFTAIYEPGLGMRQIVPFTVPPEALKDELLNFKDDRRVGLHVRHYLDEDEDGQARIVCSRLCKVDLERI